MGVLVACLTTGKGSWMSVSDLINSAEWKRVYLITNKFGQEKFTHKKEIKFVLINLDDEINIMRDKIILGLEDIRKEIGFSDVAINFTSGTGKEHMALLSAILKIGCGIRIVDLNNKILKTL